MKKIIKILFVFCVICILSKFAYRHIDIQANNIIFSTEETAIIDSGQNDFSIFTVNESSKKSAIQQIIQNIVPSQPVRLISKRFSLEKNQFFLKIKMVVSYFNLFETKFFLPFKTLVSSNDYFVFTLRHIVI